MPVLGVSSLNSGRACHGPFFWPNPLFVLRRLFGGQKPRQQGFQGGLGEFLEQACHHRLGGGKAWQLLGPCLVHVEPPVALDPRPVPAYSGPPATPGGETSRLSLV